MPIYEFRCEDCGRLSSVFVRSASAKFKAACKHCRGRRMSRVVSGFAYHKSEETILAEYGAEPKRPEDYRDPRQIGRWVERRFQEQGLEVPQQTREMIDAARQGELPDSIKDL